MKGQFWLYQNKAYFSGTKSNTEVMLGGEGGGVGGERILTEHH